MAYNNITQIAKKKRKMIKINNNYVYVFGQKKNKINLLFNLLIKLLKTVALTAALEGTFEHYYIFASYYFGRE